MCAIGRDPIQDECYMKAESRGKVHVYRTWPLLSTIIPEELNFEQDAQV